MSDAFKEALKADEVIPNVMPAGPLSVGSILASGSWFARRQHQLAKDSRVQSATASAEPQCYVCTHIASEHNSWTGPCWCGCEEFVDTHVQRSSDDTNPDE